MDIPEKRRKIENGKSMEEIEELSLTWLAKASLTSIFKYQQKNRLSTAARQIFEKISKEVEEKNCFSYPVELDEVMPDRDGYRGLLETIQKQLTSTCAPFRTNQLPTFDPFIVNFTGGSFDDPATVTSKHLIEAAKNYDKRYDDTVILKYLYERGNELTDREIEMFRNDGHFLKEGYLPVPEFEMKIGTPNAMDLLREKILTTSMCVVTGLAEYTGLDVSLFTLDKLSAAARGSDYKFEVIRQIPQSTTTNFPMAATPDGMHLSNGWETMHHLQTLPLSTFSNNYAKLVRLSEEAFQEICESPEDEYDIFRRYRASLRDNSLKAPATIKRNSNATLISFGSNIDIDNDAYFTKQTAEIEKCFPPFLRFSGNILGYTNESIQGLNKPQVYAKTPGCRTGGHLENNSLGSINFNVGPGECVWYGISLEHSGKFQRLLESRLEGASKTYLHSVDYWPQEEEILTAGIPLMKFIQKPGAMVYVGIGSYHWVQSNDFTINISWNVGQPTYLQLAMAAITHDNYLANDKLSLTPLETIAWNVAMEAVECLKKRKQGLEMDMKTRALIKRILARSLTKSQLEQEYIDETGFELVKVKNPRKETKDLRTVERCHHCTEALFNYVPMFLIPKDMEFQGRQPVCFSCIKKEINKYETKKNETEEMQRALENEEKENVSFGRNGNGKSKNRKARKTDKPVDPRTTYKVKQRYPIETLARIFDEFKIE